MGLFKDGSMEFRSRLREALTGAGHPDLAESVNADLERGAAEHQAWFDSFDGDAAHRYLLGVIADLAPPAMLDQLQIRRLDDLADLAESATLRWIWPGRERRWPATTSAWIRAIAELGGFDLGVLAAQARAVVDDMDAGDATDDLLGDAGRARKPVNWSAAGDVGATLEGLVTAIGHLPRQSGYQLMVAIATSSDPHRAVELLEARLEALRLWAVTLAAHILLLAESQIPDTGATAADVRARRWLDHQDPFVRSAAAQWWGFRRATSDAGNDEFERCIADADRGVRTDAVQSIKVQAMTDPIRHQLERLRAEPRCGWRCDSCGHQNPAETRLGCEECSTSGPNLSEALDELLR